MPRRIKRSLLSHAVLKVISLQVTTGQEAAKFQEDYMLNSSLDKGRKYWEQHAGIARDFRNGVYQIEQEGKSLDELVLSTALDESASIIRVMREKIKQKDTEIAALKNLVA